MFGCGYVQLSLQSSLDRGVWPLASFVSTVAPGKSSGRNDQVINESQIPIYSEDLGYSLYFQFQPFIIMSYRLLTRVTLTG